MSSNVNLEPSEQSIISTGRLVDGFHVKCCTILASLKAHSESFGHAEMSFPIPTAHHDLSIGLIVAQLG